MDAAPHPAVPVNLSSHMLILLSLLLSMRTIGKTGASLSTYDMTHGSWAASTACSGLPSCLNISRDSPSRGSLYVTAIWVSIRREYKTQQWLLILPKSSRPPGGNFPSAGYSLRSSFFLLIGREAWRGFKIPIYRITSDRAAKILPFLVILFISVRQ